MKLFCDGMNKPLAYVYLNSSEGKEIVNFTLLSRRATYCLQRLANTGIANVCFKNCGKEK